jgi:uncharacterized protein (TIGR00255 family)
MKHVKSMTGFGSVRFTLQSVGYVLELRGLNSKTLDLSVKIPSYIRFLEPELRAYISEFCERGKIDCSIVSDPSNPETLSVINHSVARHYINEIQSLSQALGLPVSDPLAFVLKQSELWNTQSMRDETGIRNEIFNALPLAVKEFNSFRIQEGHKLEQDIVVQLETIDTILETIRINEPARLETVKNRLLHYFKLFENAPALDALRFEQELIVHIEKSDINEEKVRLAAHLNFFKETLTKPSSGRKLAFIAQEMGREINTMGSKANDAVLQRQVVEMKDALEKIKEQCANLL